jgi:hypothetical protein
LSNTIEDLREELNSLIEKLDFDLNNKNIIELSQKLDMLIFDYYREIDAVSY